MSVVRSAARRLGLRSAPPPTPAARLDRMSRRIRRLRARNAKLTKQVARLRARKQALTERVADLARGTSALAGIPGKTRLELRRECVLSAVAADASILEIGPAHNAILPKREGYRTRTVDYLDRDGLVERYKDFKNYSPDDIEEVDYVLAPGAPLADVIPDRFDLVLASHVIEHTTSMIDFLNESARLLNPGGVLALVVPDHRYCFDRFRERSSLGRVIDSSLAPPPVHTVGTVIEEKISGSRHGGTTAWAPGHLGDYAFLNDHAKALAYGEEARKAERYIDTHNWVSTPHHLRLLLQDLHGLGFISLRECYFHDTVRHEFFLSLSVDGPGSGLSREELTVLSEGERRSLDPPTFAT
ncbi:MAG: methyltransferase domain-containing protein [Nocardioides sp.]